MDLLTPHLNASCRLAMLRDILSDAEVQKTFRHARAARTWSPSLAHCLVKVAVLGAVSKRQQAVALNLGDAARLCELAGEDPEIVEARYNKARCELRDECSWIIDAAVTEFDAQPVAMAAE